MSPGCITSTIKSPVEGQPVWLNLNVVWLPSLVIISHWQEKPGLLPTILESILKNLKKTFVNTNGWFWCELRIVAPKDPCLSLWYNQSILEQICQCSSIWWNKLTTNWSIDKKTKDIAQEFGFRLIYAIQTLLLKKQEASRLDYENVKDILIRENRASDITTPSERCIYNNTTQRRFNQDCRIKP